MSEYTPTEARICIDFCNAAAKRARADGSFMTMEEADAAFSRWMAAHDAEVRADEAAQWAQAVIVSGKQGERIGAARTGVVTEEPEWEYGIRVGDGFIAPNAFADRHVAEAGATQWKGGSVVQRRKAGPWVPVKQEGAEQ